METKQVVEDSFVVENGYGEEHVGKVEGDIE